jgi:hypothetical protein
MEAGLMRPRSFTGFAVAIALLTGGTALADGRCDLNGLVGYQIAFAKPIESYVQGGVRTKGYEGCAPDRVLVFADGTGLRCKEMVRQSISGLPTGYLFFKDMGDMRLCVDGALIDVSGTN